MPPPPPIPPTVFLDILQVVTNFIFFFPAVMCIRKRMFICAVAWVIAGSISFMYHLCKVESTTCFITHDDFRSLDHLHACVLILVVVFIVTSFLGALSVWIIIGLIFILYTFNWAFILLLGWDQIFIMHTFSAVYSIIILGILVYFFVNREIKTNGHKTWRPALLHLTNGMNIDFFVIGFITTILGLLFFPFHKVFGQEMYPVTHSFWHIFVAVGTGIMLLALKPN